ncbi:MAG: NADP-dependent malic enzyme [Sphingobacteriales bacterium 17-39-43]|uniref:NADP-dependent malic enzyme n=1 Tax=Daejeonella sp. TaxID=2805397 RepID=UPI000BDD5DA5|nr:NADP-dependent malic enzyme [Daejeonella sp.]OYY05005.1 MAG: NADP-dependent malic enzyme [Sphingobacteriia bacterium 35-40-5]OYZ31842.1 MAG: NADP-dependent malic enzyme [Sphingobacteriales bacterium 16-39-50]OZA24833.1 MAG: NADP-dependent malic enzyme [Sphingobacteriales bacterium 17-39-43]OZA61732.1 MAG: NADP-dependent malic enzyme [Sphingobacteriales bacterium 39-40-5]HQT23003.1 NADP-dependent malic enzyme [Daejeonella sp.]
MSKTNRKQDALDYHSHGRPGKIQVVPTKPTNSQRDLSLAYSPGVAEPCLRIAENKDDVYKYTAKGNLVAVISNGSAVLGLGDIGPEAGKPVMEGKGLLFKIFADIDVFDLELDTQNIDEFVTIVKALEPTFGGINLEDIKAPECFEIERRLKEVMSIPVMHDDQHGTAIISAAALINACELQKKKLDKVKIVVNGAGAAAISCTRLYVSLGARKENIVMLDRSGVIRNDRANLEGTKAEFATTRKINTLAEAVKDSDVFIGLSSPDVLTAEMLKTMAKNPIVFAMANPDPEIAYELAIKTRKDIIMATGRSDYPNQVNNVLGFPYIFRGALDVRATGINEEMKKAAVIAIAELAKKTVPESVNLAYNLKNIKFGKDYIIPKPIDLRLITSVSPAVAKAAMDSGVARKGIKDWEAYNEELKARLGLDDKLMRTITNKAKSAPKRVVFAEADNYKILKAAQIVRDEGIAIPILLGNKGLISRIMLENELELEGVNIIDPLEELEKSNQFAEYLYKKRQRRGITLFEAKKLMRDRNYYGAAMVQFGEADALISGLTKDYPSTIKPALQVIGIEDGVNRVAGMYMMLTKKGPVFFGDTTVNENPTVDELVAITALLDHSVRKFNIQPRVAMLSYSNFGSNDGAVPEKVRQAVKILHEKHKDITVDGDMQANFAMNPDLLKDNYPFSALVGAPANVLVFPNLESGNIAYKLLQEIGGAEAVGPILLGLNKPVHILQLGSSVREIVNMVTIAVVDVQTKEEESSMLVNPRVKGIFKRALKKDRI